MLLASRRFIFAIRMDIRSKYCNFLRTKATRNGTCRTAGCFLASTIRPLLCQAPKPAWSSIAICFGLRVAGESDNYGFEQEHLNNVFGAHLRITSLRGQSGIGVELLEYITPRDGHAAPANANAADISHHETVLLVDDIAGVNLALSGSKNSPVSVKQISSSELLFHASQAELIRDPDGHPLLLLQR